MPTENSPVRVVVGRIGKAHGIRGAVFVAPLTDEPDLRFVSGAQLFADTPVNRILTIADVRDHSGKLVVEFEGVADRTGAEGLRGAQLEVEVDPDQLPDDDDEYYDRQLTGLRVLVGDDQVGTVAEVLHLPGQDLLAVDLVDGEQRLVPFVSAICVEVDIEQGFVRIDPPAGLLEDLEDSDDPAEDA